MSNRCHSCSCCDAADQEIQELEKDARAELREAWAEARDATRYYEISDAEGAWQ